MEKYASLLSADAGNYESIIKRLEDNGFSGLHFDVMDGHFVKNFGFSPEIIRSLRKITGLKFSIHLQIENPEVYIHDFIKAGADIITLHPSTCLYLERELRFIKAHGIKTSIALEPYNKIEEIEKFFPVLDNILVLSVYPGFGKQKFIENSLERIKKLKNILKEKKLPITISVDGSVKVENEKSLLESGVDVLIYGSSIFI